MPTLKMVAPVLLILVLTSCAADPEPGTWQRGTAKACDSCTSDLDCAAGLLCDQDSFACKSVEQLKAKKTGAPLACDADCWKDCEWAGDCYVLPPTDKSFQLTARKCAPKSSADCTASGACKESGEYCTYSAQGGNGWPACVK